MYLGIFSINDTVYFRATTVNKQGSALDATTGPTFSVYEDGGTTALSTGSMTKVGAKDGFYEGSFTVPTATYTTGQHFVLLEATVDGETPKGAITFQLVNENQSLEETFQEIELIGQQVPGIGEGSVSIDHNFSSVDNFRVVANGTPLADVDIRAFVASDYTAGRKSNRYIVGQTRTLTDGRWATVIRLDPAQYTLEFSKVGAYRTTTTTIAVTGSMAMTMSVQSMSFDAMTPEPTPQTPQTFAVSSFETETMMIDHNFETKDDMRLISGRKPISGVDIKIYLKSDFDAGKLEEKYVVQRTISRTDGRWEKALKLDVNETYIVQFSKSGVFRSTTTTIRT